MGFLLPVISFIAKLAAPVVIPALATGAVKNLVKEAETRFPVPGSGAEKHAWVAGFFHEVIDLLRHRGIVGEPFVSELEKFVPGVSALIEEQVERLKEKRK